MHALTFHSTRSPDDHVTFEEAVMRALAPDGGLYMPDRITPLPTGFWQTWRDGDFATLATRLAGHMLGSALPEDVLAAICADAFSFDVPMVEPVPNMRVLELFHGPTLAFKDFGARWMSRVMARFAQARGRQLTILAATSGDTGGAVASAFHNVEGTRVVILYPAGRVSPLQEKQLTTLGGNVTAVEVAGSFDDCQRMVKAAFLDAELSAACQLTSANSINIARLLPQMFYYFQAARLLPAGARPVFVVPSGNFGNLTAGLFAAALGLPVTRFVAATNINDTVPAFLAGAGYAPKSSLATVSNAMDVGEPSNFERMLALAGGDDRVLRGMLSGHVTDDATTIAVMQRVWSNHGYLLDPHTAVAWNAAESWLAGHPDHHPVMLATAHPAKFLEVATAACGQDAVDVPDRLACLAGLPKVAVAMAADTGAFKSWLRHG